MALPIKILEHDIKPAPPRKVTLLNGCVVSYGTVYGWGGWTCYPITVKAGALPKDLHQLVAAVHGKPTMWSDPDFAPWVDTYGGAWVLKVR